MRGAAAERGTATEARAWGLQHGIDWGDFVRNGIEAEKLEAIGDAFALALVQHARACEAREAAQVKHHG